MTPVVHTTPRQRLARTWEHRLSVAMAFVAKTALCAAAALSLLALGAWSDQ